MNKFEKGVRVMTSILLYVSVATMVFMLVLAIGDVLGRYLFRRPIIGATEIIEMILPGIVLMSLPYTQQVKGHVMVDLFVRVLPIKPRNILSIFITFWALILCILIGWQGIITVVSYHQGGGLITNIGVPMFIPRMLVPLGAFGICLVLIVDLFHLFSAAGAK